jgi:DNA damage-inducible protein 1
MRILVSVVASHVDLENDNISLDVFPEMTVKDIKAIVADEIKVTSASQHYFFKNQPLIDENKTLTELSISEGDMLALAIQDPQAPSQRRRPQQAEQSQQRAQRPRQDLDPEQLRLQALADARVMEQVRSQVPELAETAHDRDRFHAVWDQRARDREIARMEKEEQLALLNADPLNEETQAKIENMIRLERIQENMHKALEENPECEC